MKFHPYAEVFPLIQGDDFDHLVADIKAHGLRDPIWTYEGKILDGRNRFLACQKAKVDPHFTPFEGDDPLAFVVSANVHRRHLSARERAMAAAKVATFQRGDNQHTARAASSTSQAEAARQFDVSQDSIQRAKKVVEKGSKALQQAVETGEVSLKKAAAVVELPKAEQLKAATAEPEWTEADEAEYHAQEEINARARIEAAIAADDKLAEALEQIKQLSAELAVVKRSRDHYMNQAGEAVRLVKARDREIAKLKKQIGRQAA